MKILKVVTLCGGIGLYSNPLSALELYCDVVRMSGKVAEWVIGPGKVQVRPVTGASITGPPFRCSTDRWSGAKFVVHIEEKRTYINRLMKSDEEKQK